MKIIIFGQLFHGVGTLLTCTAAMAGLQSAFHNCQSIVRHFASINSEFLEMEAENKFKSTPLLISAESGGFDSFKCLIELGANVTATDSTGSNAVHLAALKHHTKVLRYLIKTKGNEIDVWDILEPSILPPSLGSGRFCRQNFGQNRYAEAVSRIGAE